MNPLGNQQGYQYGQNKKKLVNLLAIPEKLQPEASQLVPIQGSSRLYRFSPKDPLKWMPYGIVVMISEGTIPTQLGNLH